MVYQRLIFGILLIILNACDSSNPAPQSTAIPPQGEVIVKECSGLNGSDLPCYWRYHYNSEKCNAAAPCNKLVIYYSGGGMVCDEGMNDVEHHSSLILAQYADDGYLAVCANIFIDKFQTPYLSEAQRVDLLQKSITQSNVAQTLWTGNKLLISGVSHGATAPVLAMAKTDYDEGEAWQGNELTAACFMDGVYDIQFTDEYFQDYPLQCSAVRQSVVCDRYFSGDCNSVDYSNTDLINDKSSDSTADNFSIKNWKLIECGSALPGCAGDADWIPADPIASLCASIDAGPSHFCNYGTIPNNGHLSCSTSSGSSDCRNWFNNL